MRSSAAGLLLATSLLLGAIVPETAAATGDSLWLGNDRAFDLDVLNVSKTGTVLRQFNAGVVTGIAIDVSSDTLYLSDNGATIREFELSALDAQVGDFDQQPTGSFDQDPGPGIGEDMASDGTFLYRVDFFEGVWRIDPDTGAATQFIDDPAGVVGVAFDGTDFWVGSLNFSVIRQYDATGAPTGFEFTPERPDGGSVGGLAFDPTDDTLWMGSEGRLYHYDLAGNFIDSFELPDDRYPDGLEYQPVPEPTTSLLLLLGSTLLAAWRRSG